MPTRHGASLARILIRQRLIPGNHDMPKRWGRLPAAYRAERKTPLKQGGLAILMLDSSVRGQGGTAKLTRQELEWA